MGKKEKRNKEVVDLTKFAATAESKPSLDWADDAYNVDETAAAQAQAQSGISELAKRRVMSKAVAEVENFRDKAVEYSSKVVPPDMKAPFVAFVKNLLTNIPEDDLRMAFITENLPADALTSVKLVTREVSTFGFLEFDARDTLQEALLLDGKTVRGRKMQVDIASPEQIERMCKKGISPTTKGSPVFGRDSMGQQRPFPSSGSFGDFSRDAFGTEESNGAMRAPRSTTSSNAPRPDVPVSRDMMGAAQPSDDRFGGLGGGRGGRGSRSNVSSPKTPFSGGDFGSWRDAAPAVPPAGNWRDTPVEQPTGVLKSNASKDDLSSKPKRSAGTGGSWRDTPTEAPAGGAVSRPAAAAKKPVAEAPPAEPKKVSTVKEGLSFAAAMSLKK